MTQMTSVTISDPFLSIIPPVNLTPVTDSERRELKRMLLAATLDATSYSSFGRNSRSSIKEICHKPLSADEKEYIRLKRTDSDRWIATTSSISYAQKEISSQSPFSMSMGSGQLTGVRWSKAGTLVLMFCPSVLCLCLVLSLSLLSVAKAWKLCTTTQSVGSGPFLSYPINKLLFPVQRTSCLPLLLTPLWYFLYTFPFQSRIYLWIYIIVRLLLKFL